MCSHGIIIDRYCLTKDPALRQTWHIAIDIRDNPLPFRPGDSVGIWPKNPEVVVKELIAYFQLEPTTAVVDPRTKRSLPLWTYFEEAVDLNKVSQRFAELACQSAASHEDREAVREVLATPQQVGSFDVLHFLRTFVPHGVNLSDVAAGFAPISPRLYSISSGPSLQRSRIDLTVARVQYECAGRLRQGLCSNYLITCPMTMPLRLFHQPSRHFSFPTSSDVPLIMVGSGTGVAPFRAYMQEAEVGAIIPPPCWLFFGEQTRVRDFFYEEFWKAQVAAGRLRLELAFSQDQEQKVYVQDRMWEHRSELWRWIDNGAAIFVCGNAKKMAKDVDTCLVNIAVSEGGCSPEAATRFLRELHHQCRYRRDVY